MKALISPLEIFSYTWTTAWNQENGRFVAETSSVDNCMRIADVHPTGFDVAAPFYWVDCPEDCETDKWYFKDGVCVKKAAHAVYPKED